MISDLDFSNKTFKGFTYAAQLAFRSYNYLFHIEVKLLSTFFILNEKDARNHVKYRGNPGIFHKSR